MDKTISLTLRLELAQLCSYVKDIHNTVKLFLLWRVTCCRVFYGENHSVEDHTKRHDLCFHLATDGFFGGLLELKVSSSRPSDAKG